MRGDAQRQFSPTEASRQLGPGLDPDTLVRLTRTRSRVVPKAPGSRPRERAPQRRTYLLSYEVRPTEAISGGGAIGGAIVNCWAVARTIAEARREARAQVEDGGWVIVIVGAEDEVIEDDLAEGSKQYYRQAQTDGVVCVFHTFPPEPPDA